MDKRDVYVYSYIPGLFEELSKECPELKLHYVNAVDNQLQYLKKECKTEEFEEIKKAEVLIVDVHLLRQVYHKLPKLKWAQLSYAGVTPLIAAVEKHGKPRYDVTRCSSFQHLMVEYVLSWVIIREREFMKFPKLWVDKQFNNYRGLFDREARPIKHMTFTVLGLGEIGKEIVKALKFFGGTVYGYGRQPSELAELKLDSYRYGDGLKDLLEHCDYIISVLPSTVETKYLLGGDTLKQAKKQPVLINIGRGDLICENDIVKALDNNWLGGAILDVFEVEPVPENSPLWSHPKVMITPHIAANPTAADVVDVFKRNYELYLQNKPLLYAVNFDKGY